MNTGRIAVMTVLACMLSWSCATTGARQDTETLPPPQQQEDGDADTARAPDPEPEPQPAPEAPPQEAAIRYAIPDGWEAQNQQDRNQVMFVHQQTGARVVFTVWPASGGTPQDYVGNIWAAAADDAMSDTSLEVNMPIMMEIEGRNIAMFTMVRTQQSDRGEVRITMVFLGFESNMPSLNILLIGLWPEALDAQMMEALQEIGRGITITVPDR